MDKHRDEQQTIRHYSRLRQWLYHTIFEADTPAGIVFDVLLLVAIVASVLLICADTVESLRQYRGAFLVAEWFFTILFTIEYVLRLYCSPRPVRYALSFYGLVDLISILPNYLALLLFGTPTFAVVRALRIMRTFRILKLVWLIDAAEDLGQAIWNARAKVVVFMTLVLIAVVISGAAMYEIENFADPQSQFTSIPQAIYWAIVTMTTVGYGDVVPKTPAGKLVSAVLILFGYSLIIVPTGFVSAEFFDQKRRMRTTTRTCPNCHSEGHDSDAVHCKYCGELLV